MASKGSLFRCDNCDYSQPRWFGLCPECGDGNGVEQSAVMDRRGKASRATAATFRDMSTVKSTEHERLSTGIGEFDRVLGGGVIPGSYIVLAGAPGSGKSTLASQTMISLTARGKSAVYVSGEEADAQARMRFERLGAKIGSHPLLVSTEPSVERICAALNEMRPDVAVVDSIQSLYSEENPGRPGSISQVMECGEQLRRVAKTTGTSIILVGQVTKDGNMAGPRQLEHMVDVVLQYEDERTQELRVLRAVKNRFGAVDEIGVFEMTSSGMVGVSDPSKLFISDFDERLPGAAVTAALEGTRIMLCEIQALVRPSNSPMPARQAAGIDPKRLAMLLAVMGRRWRLSSHDVYVQAAGGMKLSEPSTDLAICLAIASAAEKRPVRDGLCAFGEVTLQGRIRKAWQADRRGKEAERLSRRTYSPQGLLSEAIEGALGPMLNDGGAGDGGE